jgi:hypothetical protein
MFNKKVDLDFIPGLDDDIKVFLPGNKLFQRFKIFFYLLWSSIYF